MSEAEDKFRAVIVQALEDRADTYILSTAGDYADAIVGSLKLDDWLIRKEEIYEVEDSEFEVYPVCLHVDVVDEEEEDE